MTLFEKKESVFREKNKTAWLAARTALKNGGITGVRAGSIETEPPVCGCGAKLDPRDFGGRGKIDRNLYYIEVPVSQAKRARQILGEQRERR